MELYVEGEELFEAGNIDEFEVSVGDIGKPYKIRIGRQDRDRWEGWFLDEVSNGLLMVVWVIGTV